MKTISQWWKICPECGNDKAPKLSRRDGNVNDDWRLRYCKPIKSTGKGCGGIFKQRGPRQRTGCEMAISNIATLDARQGTPNAHLAMVALGHSMVSMMKELGIHDPRARKIKAREIYEPYREHVATKLNSMGFCGCGCGSPITATNERLRYASHACKDSIWQVAQMIATQNIALKFFLVKIHGDKCACCGVSPAEGAGKIGSRYYHGGHGLEVDHIIEVSAGGGLCWVDNFQLLCSICHKAKTRMFAKAKAFDRRQTKQSETGQISLF